MQHVQEKWHSSHPVAATFAAGNPELPCCREPNKFGESGGLCHISDTLEMWIYGRQNWVDQDGSLTGTRDTRSGNDALCACEPGTRQRHDLPARNLVRAALSSSCWPPASFSSRGAELNVPAGSIKQQLAVLAIECCG